VSPLSPRANPICYLPPRRLALSAWSLHVPFGMYLVDLLRPTSIVELGTRRGVSYSAFCQAVRYLGIRANCVAIDSWSGDAHTGAYGAAVMADLRKHHDSLYSDFSRLEQCLFEEALASFANESIDLLHIDGLHTYDAVRGDFEGWLPRMSQRGVVLFHDVTERRADFGVWRLWSELKERYPSLTFHHGHGLGVLGVGGSLPESVAQLLNSTEAQAQDLRTFFQRQGRLMWIRTMLESALKQPGALLEAILRYSNPRANRRAARLLVCRGCGVVHPPAS
jgi:O-antigen biosynthesis protein